MKTLVIAHVYYPQFWPELAACIRTVGGDLVVTYVDEAAVAAARRDFPSATFVACENRGYDVWPFLKALRETDLSAYDLVVKLHTKRDLTGAYAGYCCNDAWFGGARWRNYLLAPYRSPENWRRTAARFADTEVGMVADRHVIFTGNAQPDDIGVFDRACEEVSRLTGQTVRAGRYVAGSMFAVRATLLVPLKGLSCMVEDFDRPVDGRFTTYAHVLERAFGLLVSAANLRIEAFNGSVERRVAFYAGRGLLNKIGRFLFYRRYVDGEVKVKICGIQVRHAKLQGEAR